MGLVQITTATSVDSLGLDPRRIYSILNDDATDAINIAINSASADGDDGFDKIILSPGTSVDIGPGATILRYAAAANNPRLLISSIVATSSQLAANNQS